MLLHGITTATVQNTQSSHHTLSRGQGSRRSFPFCQETAPVLRCRGRKSCRNCSRAFSGHLFLHNHVCVRVGKQASRILAVEPLVVELRLEDPRHSVMDISDLAACLPCEDHKCRFPVLLHAGQAGKIGDRSGGLERVLDFLRNSRFPLEVPAGRNEASAVLHGIAEHGFLRRCLDPGIDDCAFPIKPWKSPAHGLQLSVFGSWQNSTQKIICSLSPSAGRTERFTRSTKCCMSAVRPA